MEKAIAVLIRPRQTTTGVPANELKSADACWDWALLGCRQCPGQYRARLAVT